MCTIKQVMSTPSSMHYFYNGRKCSMAEVTIMSYSTTCQHEISLILIDITLCDIIGLLLARKADGLAEGQIHMIH